MPKVSYINLGCKLNFSEVATIVRKFVEEGYTQVSASEKADIVIVNTCAVTSQAERKSKFAIKKAHKISPDAKIVVIGCAAQVDASKFVDLQGVEMVVGTKDKFNIFDLLRVNHKKYYSCDVSTLENFNHAYSLGERTRAFLKVQDGCDYVCTYCTIPKARGKSRNPSIKSLVEDARKIAETGVKEIVLTGVNIGDFGRSTGESFLQLIEQLDKVQGIERYRISSIEPNLLTDEIIDFVASSQKFAHHFHIPLQSGSDEVLKAMKRRYNTKVFADKIKKVTQKISDAFFGIDVIVGFPTETDENFAETYELLNSLPISYLHIFPYSDRPGTPSFLMKPKVPSEKIKQREQKLKGLSDKKHKDFYKRFVNTKVKVLFEAKNYDGKIMGYTDNYLRVAVDFDQNLIGKLCQVEIKNYKSGVFEGKLI